jgi:transcriptional regulator with XRE-family HTH domain
MRGTMKASGGKTVLAEGHGEFLRRERELRHISLDDVAERTKINRRYLAAIEEGHYDRLPGEAFIRGFIRAYAQSVGLDPEDTLLLYTQARVAQEPPPVRAEWIPQESRTRDARSLIWLLVAGVIVIGGTLLGIVSLLTFDASSLLRLTSPTDVADAPAVSPPLILTAIADSDTWLRLVIDDRESHDILLRAGQSTKWLGHERFLVSIGNARATRLELNGRELTMPLPPQSVLRHYIVSRDMLQ